MLLLHCFLVYYSTEPVQSHLSPLWLFATLWTVVCQAPLSMSPCSGDSENTEVGCHALLQRIFLTQGLNACLLCLTVLASRFFTISATWKATSLLLLYLKTKTLRNISQKRNSLKWPYEGSLSSNRLFYKVPQLHIIIIMYGLLL